MPLHERRHDVHVEKVYYELGRDLSPLCTKGRHDRCAAYDNMVIRCTCACHGKKSKDDQ